MDMLNPIFCIFVVHKHTLFFLSMYLVYRWNFFLRKGLTWFIPVLRTSFRCLGPGKINLVYHGPW